MRTKIIAPMKARRMRREYDEFGDPRYFVTYRAVRRDVTVVNDAYLDELHAKLVSALKGSEAHLCRLQTETEAYRRSIEWSKLRRGIKW